MAKRFARNIDGRGRWIRAGLGVALLAGALWAGQASLWAGLALLAAGGFTLFEAVRGWCVMRACGFKTRF